MRVIEIVKQHLTENGFDGLVQPDAECGCLLSEGLHPCDSNYSQCEPGYRIDDPTNPGEWLVTTVKPNTTPDLFAGQGDAS